MFTYSNWEYFCFEIEKRKCNCLLARDLSGRKEGGGNFILIKHDIETNLDKALKIAEIENKYNIKSTFYVQSYLLEGDINIKILNKIKGLGHEVTYHYDVLDSNGGNWSAADKEFEKTLSKFQEFGFPVETVCPHGNPVLERNGWNSNKDFFRNRQIKDKYSNILDIVVDYPDLCPGRLNYVSDAGYKWNIITDISNNDKNGTEPNQPLAGLPSLLKLFSTSESFIISSHPHRWTRFGGILFVRTVVFKVVRVIVRFLSKIGFINKILSRYYFLAKKI